jgi:hypothetical protein
MQNFNHNIGFWETKRQLFFAEIGLKSPKIVIITSTIGVEVTYNIENFFVKNDKYFVDFDLNYCYLGRKKR